MLQLLAAVLVIFAVQDAQKFAPLAQFRLLLLLLHFVAKSHLIVLIVGHQTQTLSLILSLIAIALNKMFMLFMRLIIRLLLYFVVLVLNVIAYLIVEIFAFVFVVYLLYVSVSVAKVLRRQRFIVVIGLYFILFLFF